MNLYQRLSQCSKSLWQPVSYKKYGSRRCHSSRRILDDTNESSHQLGSTFKRLANAFCNGLLWNRADGDGIKPLRSSSFWCRGFSIQSKTSRSHDRSRQSFSENDASAATCLHPNDRAQVGDFDGRLRLDRRRLRYVRSRAGNRSVSASRRLCAWVPTKTRNAHRRSDGNPENHRRGQHPIRRGWKTNAPRSRTSLVFCNTNRDDDRRHKSVRRLVYTASNSKSGTNTRTMVAA